MKAKAWVCPVLFAAILLCALPKDARPNEAGLADLSIEELGNVTIVSSSKRAVRLSDAPSSVFVITADDIRRSGATSLPEALRLAPNLQVARISTLGYAISARGFNSTSANKLLVLIDGRSVYTPLFSGVFWDVQDVMLEDIERIEVVSGPGGTLWGVNAVNGVINIITRSSRDTQGVLATGGAGNAEQRAAARYGSSFDSDTKFRVYATQTNFSHTEIQTGADANDAAERTLAGFRADWAKDAENLMVRGDVYSGIEGQPLPGSIYVIGDQLKLGNVSTRGANLTGVWEHHLEDGAGLSVQLYYDRTSRTVPPTFSDSLDVLDAQFQYSANPLGVHTFVWGAGYRYGIDRVTNSIYVAILPANLNQSWSDVFGQDEITLTNEVQLTLGARVERNDYTGAEFLPNARLAWKPAPDQLLWTSASRAVRAPSRLDHDIYVPYAPGLPPPDLLRGGPNVESELANDYELGYRGTLTERVSLSTTVYHTVYNHLRTQEIDPTFTYVYFANGMQGTVSGVEAWSTIQAANNWRLNAGVSRMRQDLQLSPGSNDVTEVATTEGTNPPLWWILRSSFDLWHQTDLDLTLRHVGALTDPAAAVPGYTTLDLRYGWQATPRLEVSLSGQNLLGGGHGEFTNAATRSEFKPDFYLRVVYRQ